MKNEITGYASIDKPWLKYYSKESIENEIPHMTIYDYLYISNKEYENNIALNYFGRKITFNELFEKIDETVSSLLSLGVKKGDVISISMPTFPETVYLFYALSKIGAISNMIDPRTNIEGIQNYLSESNSKYCFVVDVALPKFNKIISKTKLKSLISISPSDSLPFALRLGYSAKQLLEDYKKNPIKIPEDSYIKWKSFLKKGQLNIKSNTNEYEENYPVTIVHTGGTTGIPKGVVLTNDNLNAAAYQCQVSGIDMKREHNWLNIMPPFIAYGVGNGLHLPLVIGMETILIPQFDPNHFDDLLIKYKPNHMVGVPSHYSSIIKSEKLKNKDLSYIIAPTVGGDTMNTKLENDTNDFLKKHNCSYQVTKGYGMTEVSAAVSVCISNECNRIGSVGIPFSKTVISIFDPKTQEELKYNQEGEVCITGPNTMLKYFNNEFATKDILKLHKDGKVWVHSGDIGYMTEDGFLYIVDRKKRLIIRHDGFKIFPSMIENVILEHPSVKECKVVGLLDINHSQGSLPVAHIVLNDNYIDKSYLENIQNEIKQLCSIKLPEYAIPVNYKFNNKFPVTLIGKTDFSALELDDLNDLKNTLSTKTVKNIKLLELIKKG